jgi:flagellar basal-body rod modification protein FlgD
MFSVAKTNSEITAYNAQKASSQDSTDSKSIQDRFMKMLVAQMSNQDPLNPMDNAQMTSQMAQINTVSGIQKLNDTVKDLMTQFGNLQALQGVSLIGRTAMVKGNTPMVTDGKANGGLKLSKAADSVTVDIIGKNGQVLGTLNMGARDAGQHMFEVPLNSGVNPADVASFKVTAVQGGQPVAQVGIGMVPVVSVGMKDGVIQLTGANGKTFGYGDVAGFR